MLDCLFTVFVNGTMIVLVWRGLWELIDVAIPPEDTLSSGLYTLGLGYVFGVILYPLQYPIRNVSDKLSESFYINLFLEDAYMIAASTVPVFVWRGVWLIADALVLPENKVKSFWLTHAIGFVGLMLLRVSNSVIVRGCVLDGEHEKDSDGIFDISYIRQCRNRPSSGRVDTTSNDAAVAIV